MMSTSAVPEKRGWGILGTGNIARVLAEAVNASGTGRLTAVGSRSQAAADEFGEKFGIPGRYGSYDGVLLDPNVQVVYISLPNNLHARWALRCAQAGKHILCEKPLTTNFAEAMAVVEAARGHDVFLMEAFMYRCSPQTARLVQLIREGAIGDVRLIQASFSYNLGPKYDNIRLQNEAAGGGIMDVGCYPMSMARLIAGAARGEDFADPAEVKGWAHLGPRSRIDEWAVAAVRFPGDILANLACGTQVGVESKVCIWGSEGGIVVPNPWFPGRAKDAPSTLLLHRAGRKEAEEVVVPGGDGLYTLEVDIVGRHVAARQAPAPSMTWADSLGNMKALDRWRQEAGLLFDAEKAEALATPISGRPLARRPGHAMTYGHIEGVDKPLSRLVMGSMVLGSRNLPLTAALLDYFFEIGGNGIDTAYVYGGGRSEEGVGQWIKMRGVRDQVVLIGKGAASTRCDPEMVTRELLQSLDRLQVDSLDLYLMHRDNPQVPAGEFVACLNEHKRAGRLRAFGGSNWLPERLQEANDYAASHGLTGFAASSPNFALAGWNEPMWSDCVTASDPASFAWYQRTRMPLLAWSSQASGFFTGRYRPDDRQNPAAADIVRVWFNDDNFRRLERAEALAQQKGVTATQIALAYVLCQPLEIFALIGPQTIEETRTSAQALEVELSPEQLRWLQLGD